MRDRVSDFVLYRQEHQTASDSSSLDEGHGSPK